jgi:hypothetical protein
MRKSELLAALKSEIQRYNLSTFIDAPPSIAQGGRGVVVTGCPMCRKQFGTIAQFVDHLTNDILPPLLDRLQRVQSPENKNPAPD